MENEIIAMYLCQVTKYPLLSRNEEKFLADAIEGGDLEARNTLVQSNLRLVVSVAKKYLQYKVSFIDLIQEGNIGLLTAATKFRSSFETRFSTYAFLWIQQFKFLTVRKPKLGELGQVKIIYTNNWDENRVLMSFLCTLK